MRRSLAVAATIAASGAATPVAAATTMTSAAAARSQRVIVVMRDGATGGAVRAVRRSGGRVTHGYHLIDGFAATVSAAERKRLAHDPAVARVVPDSFIPAAPRPEQPQVADAARAPANTQDICPSDPAKPLEPEELQTTHADEAQRLATGRGVTVAFPADGLDIDNPEFIRPDGSRVFADYQDFTGEGPDAPTPGGEAFGDASMIAAQGSEAYDVSKWVNPAHPLPAGCTIRVRGVAPGARLVGLKTAVSGGSYLSVLIQGLDYAVDHDHVDVLSQSFSAALSLPDSAEQLIRQLDARAVAQGVVVVAVSGDSGAVSSPQAPSSDPAVISAGASTTYRLRKQIGFGGADLTTGWLSGNVSSISTGGFTQEGRTVDLVAPGDGGWAACTPDPARFWECFDAAGRPANIFPFGGTSMAGPMIAGAAALVIEAYRSTHGGRSPSPALVKQLLTGTATDLGQPGALQGSGQLNVLAAVQAARSVGDHLVVGPTQAELAGPAGSMADQTFTVTNAGEHAQTIRPRLRELATTLSNRSGSVHPIAASEAFTDSNGAPRVGERVTFEVPASADTLQGSISWPGSAGAVVRLTLIDPRGAFAGNSLPQGFGNHGRVDVAHPTPGRWTAVIYTRPDTLPGAVRYEFLTRRFRDADAVFPPALRLGPGQSGSVTVRTRLPSDAGDSSRDLVLEASGGGTSVVPIALRSLVRLDARGGSFRGDITGGNGRAFAAAQLDAFEFDVPRGHESLGVGLTVDGEPAGTELWGALIDPAGHLQAAHSTSRYDKEFHFFDTDALQVGVTDPRAGRWRFVAFVSRVGGSALSQPYRGRVTFDAPKVRTSGLPDSTRTVIGAGTSRTATIAVRNDGPAAEDLFLDPRLPTSRRYRVISFTGDQDTPLPLVDRAPAFLLPRHSNAVDVQVDATAPVRVVAAAGYGPPEFALDGTGTSVSGHYEADEVTSGQWVVTPALAGPFSGPAQGIADTQFSARMKAIDTDAEASTGDIWLETVDPEAPDDDLMTVAPHESGTMTVTFTPTAPPGSVVRGTIYVNDWDGWLGFGNDLTAIPYAYTVGPPRKAGR